MKEKTLIFVAAGVVVLLLLSKKPKPAPVVSSAYGNLYFNQGGLLRASLLGTSGIGGDYVSAFSQ